MGLNSTARYFTGVMDVSGYQSYTFVKDVGLYRNQFGEVIDVTILLQGFIKDGVAYGDTSLVVVGVKDEEGIPAKFSLSQNYPNPFNPTTNIEFRIANFGFVSLKVFDVLGREVTTLVNEEKQPGVYEVEFNATQLSSGIYFYKLQAENYSSTKKMIYLK